MENHENLKPNDRLKIKNLMMIWEHWASLFPEERSPVRTWPICRQFSKPTTSILLSPISCTAPLRSMRSPREEVELYSLSPSFFFFRLALAFESPHMFVPEGRVPHSVVG